MMQFRKVDLAWRLVVLALGLSMLSTGCWSPDLWDEDYDDDSEPHCGNGLVQPDFYEDCDDGRENNSDTEPDACRSDCRIPSCYDGVIDSGETCARGTGRAPGCADFGYTRGVVGCTADCQLLDSQCSLCGDGVAEGTVSTQRQYEACDGVDIRGQTCESLGRQAGSLSCTERCTMDTSACTESGAVCGNGVPEDNEACDDGNLASHDGCSSGCTLEMPRWVVDATDMDFPELVAYEVAYDARRGRLVLYGVIQGYHRVATWELVDATWVEVVTANSPPAQLYGALLYDTARQRVVLWGDSVTTAWEFDGADWSERTGTAEPTLDDRYCHRVYDSGRSRTVAMCAAGSSADGYVYETWEHDGVAWENRNIGPNTRFFRDAALAYDEHRERVVYVSGDSGPPALRLAETSQTETWEYDGSNWAQTAVSTSPTLSDWSQELRMAYDSIRGRMVLLTTGEIHESWEYDGDRWTETTSPLGSQWPEGVANDFSGEALVYDPRSRGLHLFPYSLQWLGRYRSDSDWPDEYCAPESENDLDLDGIAGCADPDCWTHPACRIAAHGPWN